MGLRIDTSNDTYHWAISDYWYNNPVHITIYNDDATPAKLGGIKLQLIACNAGGHAVTQIPTVQAAGQSGTFALYEYNSYTRISQIVTVAAESRSNLCTADSSEPFSNTQTWFIPRYTKNVGAQYNQYSYDGDYISQQDYNNAFYTFKLSSPLVIPANSYAQVTLRLEGGWGTWQLSDLVNATPLPSYQITYKPNGGNWSGSTSDVVHEVVQGENDSLPPNPTRSGYNFTGWSPSGAPPTNVQQNHTYTAQWEVATTNYTFWRNYNSSDNTTLKTGTTDIGTTIASVKPADPTREAYTFQGWGKTRVGPVVGNNTQITTSVHDFYAQWAVQTGSVTFYRNYDLSDNTVVATATDVPYVNTTLGDIKPEDPVRMGYEFLGWALARDTGQLVDGTPLWDSLSHQPRTAFYAVWKRLASIWVVEEVTVGGVTQKQWVKKLNAHKVVEDSSHVKSWDDMPPREVVEDSQHNKSWEEKW
jgi:uncharacterized repeat protein (TIGR02543 family)